MGKRAVAPNLDYFVRYWIGNALKSHRPVVLGELRALLACHSALRKLRAAGGAWDVEARGMADRALSRLDKVSK